MKGLSSGRRIAAAAATAAAVFLGLAGARPANAQAVQQWIVPANGTANGVDYANSVATDAAGNVYVTGPSAGSGSGNDFVTMKYDPNGTAVWGQRYNGPGNANDIPFKVAADAAGNVYVAGGSAGTTSGTQFTVVKYNAAGVQQWAARIGNVAGSGDAAFDLVPDGAGGVIATGQASQSGQGGNYLTIKYDANGTAVWAQPYNGPANASDVANAIARDPAGNVYVTGQSAGSGTSDDVATIKYSPDGAVAWIKRYNGAAGGSDRGQRIAVDAAGSAYVAAFEATGSNNAGVFTTLKYDTAGTPIWIRKHGGTRNLAGLPVGIAVDNAGGVYVAGPVSSGSLAQGGTSFDYVTLKYDFAGGEPVWAQTYNGPANGNDFPFGLAVDAARNVYVTGQSVGFGTGSDVTTVKYDVNGNQRWVRRASAAGDSPDFGNAVAVDAAGNVVVAGGLTNAGGNIDFVTVKYRQYGWAATAHAVGPDGRTRMLWTHDTGAVSLWRISPNDQFEGANEFGPFPGWSAASLGTGSDNKTRILWRHTSGAISLWRLSATNQFEGTLEAGPFPGWSAAAISVGADNKTRVLWRHSSGAISLWRVSPTGTFEGTLEAGPFLGWTATTIGTGGDNKTRVLWNNVNGAISLWTVSANSAFEGTLESGPFPGWSAVALSVGADSRTRLLWRTETGASSLWTLSPTSIFEKTLQSGPYPGVMPTAPATGGDNVTRLLWTKESGAISLWKLTPNSDFFGTFEAGPF